MKKLVIATIVAAVMAVAALAFAANQTMYVCGCGDSCGCSKQISTEPGKCGCNKDMVPMMLMSEDGKTATLCSCGGMCSSCTISKDDPTKCSCGNAVRKVSLKGMYVCGCGESCKCNTISDKEGTCGCGKPLVKVD